MVEYDTATVDLLRALKESEAAAAPAAPGQPAPAPTPGPAAAAETAAPKVDAALLDSAHAGYTRAYGLAESHRQKSEAALALGNVEAQQNKLDDAIRSFRLALKEDVRNARARANLRRALLAKQEQQKQEQQKQQKEDGGDEQKNDEKKNDEKKNSGQEGADKKDESAQDGAQPADAQQGKTPQQKRAEALRLLDALRTREKPLSPLEMRGQGPKRTKEKDW